MATQKFEDYSPEAQAYAYEQANRKASGRRITQYGESQENRNAYAALLNENISIRTAVQEGNLDYINRNNFNPAEYPVESVTLTEQAPQKLQGVIVSDTKGGTVYTRYNTETGQIATQNFVPNAGSNVTSYEAISRVNADRQAEQQARIDRPAFVNAGDKGTRTDLAPQGNFGDVQAEPYLKREITGYTRDPVSGEQVPVYSKVIYVDPTVQGQQFEREATAEETKQYNQRNSILKATTEPTQPSVVREAAGVVKQIYFQNNVSASEYLTTLGANNKNIDVIAEAAAEVLSPFHNQLDVIYNRPNPINEYLEGNIRGVLLDIRDKPYKNILLFGAGRGVGLLFESTPLLIRAGLSKVFPSSAEIGGELARIGTVGTGVGFGIYGAKQVLLEQVNPALSAKERGELLGVGIKDALVFGYGFGKGIKDAQIIQGEIRTFGREGLQLETLTKKEVIEGTEPFLLAPKNKQLSLFRDSPYRLPNEPAGAFHSTPTKFYNGVITPAAGSSELAGLYGAYGISPQFLKIQGSSSGINKFSLAELFKLNRPAIAYLEPLGFRVNRVRSVEPFKIGDQTFKFEFSKPARKGFADVPLQKNEAETVFRIEAGEYSLKNTNFYTTVKDVKVPIDTFQYADTLYTVKNIESFKPSNYEYIDPLRPDRLSYSSGRTSSRTSSISSTQTSLTLRSLEVSSPLRSSVRTSSSVLYSITRRSSVSRTSSVSSVSPSSSDISSATSSSSVISGFSSPSRTSRTPPPSSYSSLRNPPSIPYARSPASYKFKSSDIRKATSSGFRTEVKRAGKYVPLAGVFSKGEALKRGVFVTSRDISASFRIVPVSQRVEATNDYTPNSNVFRSYRIEGSKRIPLYNTYIQKAGTRKEPTIRGARLASNSEIKDLISYKRR